MFHPAPDFLLAGEKVPIIVRDNQLEKRPVRDGSLGTANCTLDLALLTQRQHVRTAAHLPQDFGNTVCTRRLENEAALQLW